VLAAAAVQDGLLDWDERVADTITEKSRRLYALVGERTFREDLSSRQLGEER
jgi:hypothetical protein